MRDSQPRPAVVEAPAVRPVNDSRPVAAIYPPPGRTYPNIINALKAAQAHLQTPALRFGDGLVVKLPRGYSSAFIREGSLKRGSINVASLQAYALVAPVREALNQLEQDVAGGLQAYGQKTGQCGCCGRTLTHPTSVKLGIGPVCAGRYGFSFAGVDLTGVQE